MVIYAEYLFAENFITGLLILHLTGKICGVKPAIWRLAAGGALCGFYSFILFWQGAPMLLSAGLKIGFSFGLVLFVFRTGWGRKLVRTAAAFYLVSFAAGGVTIGLMYFGGAQGISANSALYVDGLNYVNIASGFLAAYLGMSLFGRWLAEKRLAEQMEASVTVVLKECAVTVDAMVDTGNFLMDPVTKKPVIILEAEAARLLFPASIRDELKTNEKAETLYETLSQTSVKHRLRLIPFQSVGQSQGILLGVKPDTVTVTGRDGSSRKVEVILGIYPGSLGENWDRRRCKALLPPTITEGGIASNAQ